MFQDTLTYQKYSYQSILCATIGTWCVLSASQKCSIFQVWLIACYTKCLGPSLISLIWLTPQEKNY